MLAWLAFGVAQQVLWTGAVETTDYALIEMYAAGSAADDFGAPENLNVFDAAGLAKYLVTEVVVESGKNPERNARYLGVDTVAKYHMRILNPLKSIDVNVQAEFAPFVPFQHGAIVNENDTGLFARSGDLVGIQAYHPPAGDVRYPSESTYYWWSLSGPCPNLPNGEKSSAKCLRYGNESTSKTLAGGLCHRVKSPEVPDGTHGCVYYVESYETLELDEIVGMKHEDCGGRACSTWLDFRTHCTNKSLQFENLGHIYCKEYDFPECMNSCEEDSCKAENEVGTAFWLGRCNPKMNSERLRIIEQAFGGNSNAKHYASNPPCEKYAPMCNKPIPDAGIAYCHRDQSGVCDACYVPGTVNPPETPLQNVVECRLDLFMNKKLPQYQESLPECSNDCSGACSNNTKEDLCCLYTGKCSRDWQADEWGFCDAECGNGTKHRKVRCPFEDVLGSCDEEKRPANRTKCRGQSCPWNKTSFGDWGACDNGCGNGIETQSLICDCPDDCPLGEKECSNSSKPKQPTRPCFPLHNATAPDFCADCPADGGRCRSCLQGFDTGKGASSCSNSVRVAKATYRLTANSSLVSGYLASALVPSVTATFKTIVNASVQVASLSEASTLLETSLRRLSSGHAVDIEVVAASIKDTDESLNDTAQKLESLDMKKLAAELLMVLPQHGCTKDHKCSVPKELALKLQKSPEPLCPSGAVWANGCPINGPTSGGFPGWAVALIVAIILLVVAAAAAAWRWKRTARGSLLGS